MYLLSGGVVNIGRKKLLRRANLSLVTYSFSSSKVPFKSRASVDSHRASDTVESQNPTQYPNKEKIWHDSSPKDGIFCPWDLLLILSV